MSNAVQIYYLHKHEGEYQNNSNWERKYNINFWGVCAKNSLTGNMIEIVLVYN